jgi:CRISPR-associated protein Cas2
MRNAYIVAYDISDATRLRRVYKKMRAFGDRIQFSVFRCELNASELVLLQAALTDLIHTRDDQVLVIPLGPVQGRHDSGIRALGRPFVDTERRAVVV